MAQRGAGVPFSAVPGCPSFASRELLARDQGWLKKDLQPTRFPSQKRKIL